MTQIIVDGSVANQMRLGQPAEICDPTGRVLGCFVPMGDMTDWEQLTPDVSEEELVRRLNANEKTYTTAEVIKHLESL